MKMFASSVVFIRHKGRKGTTWRIWWFGYSCFIQESELYVWLQTQVSDMWSHLQRLPGCRNCPLKGLCRDLCRGSAYHDVPWFVQEQWFIWGAVCRLLHAYPQSKHRAKNWKKNRNTACLLVRSPTANEHCNEQRDSHRLGISLLMLSHQGPLQGSYLDQSLIKTSVHVSTDMQLLEKQPVLRTAFYRLWCSCVLNKKAQVFVSSHHFHSIFLRWTIAFWSF